MSSKNSNSRRRTEPSILAQVSNEELKSIRVAIKRHNIRATGLPLPIQRDLGDPKDLVVHCVEGEGRKPIFDRDDILVNPREDHPEHRMVLTEENSSPPHRPNNHSKSPTPKRRSRSRSYSPNHPNRNRENSPRRPSEYPSRSPLKPGEYRPSKDEQCRHSRRSRTPQRSGEYRRSREREYRRRSKTPLRPGEYRPGYGRSRSPRPVPRRSRSRSVDRKSKRRSVSPSTSYARYKVEKSHSPSRHMGESSGAASRRSERSYNVERRSPPRHERRESRSPTRSKRRSPSYHRERDYRRRSRSPSKYDRRIHRISSRSPSRSKRNRSRTPPPEMNPAVMAMMQGYYDMPEYWIPTVRPGFVPPIYPGPYPRSMRPMMMPRGPMMVPYGYPPRMKLPVYNNRQVRKVEDTSNNSSTTKKDEAVTSDMEASCSGTNTAQVSDNKEADRGVIVEEPEEEENK